MDIKGKIHCFFEQSGTFKNEFKKLGFEAEDYDIQNEFGETDNVIDLFAEIEKCYTGGASIFDKISKDDLILAFFPCIYFETLQQTYYSLESTNYRAKTTCEKIELTIERIKARTRFHILLYKLVWICEKRELRLILENPSAGPNYLITGQNFPRPTFVDNNRMRRGDYFVKPTAYWFFNCSQTYGRSYQNDKPKKTIKSSKGSKKAGVCSMERSMISKDYARNFIHDFILGKEQRYSERQLF
nr:MAG TPA: hypothetical protein [Caudoviricetes sp.]